MRTHKTKSLLNKRVKSEPYKILRYIQVKYVKGYLSFKSLI